MRSAIVAVAAVTSAWAQAPRFEKDILPIFTANCFSCHGGTAMVGLDLRTASSALRGSHQGKVIEKGASGKSLLFQKLSSKAMPPPAFNLKLTDKEIETVRQWIDAGTPSDEAETTAARWKEQSARFERDALPVLKAKCFACHASEKAQAGLDLRTLDSIVKGSANGPVLEEGAADKSILIRRIASGTMPPKGAGTPLTPDELATLRRWIDGTRFGARESAAERTAFSKAEAPEITDEARKQWAFQTPRKLAAPAIKNRARVRNPIDGFVLARLEPKGLTLSNDASNLTLLRRAHLDLTGLPPSPQAADEFLSDTKPGAYERLIDRLLESKQFGEKWGRHWLDTAGYSDAAGFDNCFPVVELYEGMWRYRDYVVNAFNDDKPYDRFVTEQLAGDELHDWRNAKNYTPEIREALIATGYLRSVYDRTDADIVNLVGERYDVLFHLMEKVSTNLMGLTVGCARCHSHKFDPIPQRDYYRLQAVFLPAFNPMNWKQPKNRFLADVAKPEEEAIRAHNAEVDRSIAELEKQAAGIKAPVEAKLAEAKLALLPEGIRADAKSAVDTPPGKRTDVQKYLAGKFEKQIKVAPEDVEKALKDDDRAELKKIGERIKSYRGYRKNAERIQALWDVGPPPVARLLQRGAVESPGPRVQPGVLTVLARDGGDLSKPAQTAGETTGMRLAFAQWLISREHPLTARVFVNRVWQHLFGRGIAASPDNFGKLGTPPTHPELLDWLAVDFMENGWKPKRLIRQIMLSSTYRQSSRSNAAGEKADPLNNLFWRMNLKRLEAEQLRDSVLAASGGLDPAMGGPPVMLKARADGSQELVESDAAPAGKRRRSLYIMSRRNYPMQFLQVFDFPVMQVNCNRRSASATPLQSLAMLNDEFVLEQSAAMAQRVRAAGGDPVIAAYKIAFSRAPDTEEALLAKDHLRKQEETYRFANAKPGDAANQALRSLCQMLLSSNEFLYAD